MSDKILFMKLHPEAIIPQKSTPYSAGYDLFALEDAIVIGGEGSVLVKTGIAVCLPKTCYGRVAVRSGLSIREHLATSAGVIIF